MARPRNPKALRITSDTWYRLGYCAPGPQSPNVIWTYVRKWKSTRLIWHRRNFARAKEILDERILEEYPHLRPAAQLSANGVVVEERLVGMPISVAVDRYLDTVSGPEKSVCMHVFDIYFKGLTLSLYDHDDLEQHFKQVSVSRRYNANTIRHYYTTLQRFFDYWVARQDTKVNPLRVMPWPDEVRWRGKIDLYSQEEMTRIVQGFHDVGNHRLAELFRNLPLSALRRNEMLSVGPDDIDIKRGVMVRGKRVGRDRGTGQPSYRFIPFYRRDGGELIPGLVESFQSIQEFDPVRSRESGRWVYWDIVPSYVSRLHRLMKTKLNIIDPPRPIERQGCRKMSSRAVHTYRKNAKHWWRHGLYLPRDVRNRLAGHSDQTAEEFYEREMNRDEAIAEIWALIDNGQSTIESTKQGGTSVTKMNEDEDDDDDELVDSDD